MGSQQNVNAVPSSFRPTSLMKRGPSNLPRQASNLPHQGDNRVEVGSVWKRTATNQGGLSFKAAALGGPSLRTTAAALVLGTTPMGSLPIHFFTQRLQSTFTSVTSEGSSWHRYLRDVNGAGMDRLIYVADIKGPVARDHLHACIDILVERHAMLRTSLVDGRLHVFPSASSDFRLIPATSTSNDETLERIFLNEINKPFDAESHTLLRVRLLQRAATDSNRAAGHVLALVFHRAVACTRSIAVVLEDLKATYQNAFQIIEKRGDTVVINNDVLDRVLPRTPTAYDLYCTQEQNYLSYAPKILETKQYWIEQLEKRAPLEMPTDRPRASNYDPTSALCCFTVKGGTAELMNNWSKAAAVPLPQCYLSAFVLLLYRYTSQDSLTFAVEQSLHDDAFENTVGPMSNFTIHTVSTEEARSCSSFAQLIRSLLQEAEPHRQYPFVNMMRDGKVAGQVGSGKFPIADVCFVHDTAELGGFLYGGDSTALPFAGLEFRTSKLREKLRSASAFDLTLHYWEYRGRVQCAVEYNTSLFETTTIERLTDNFLHLLRHIGEKRGEMYTIKNVPLVAPKQSEQLLCEFNENVLDETSLALSRNEGVHGLIRDAVANFPHKVALAMSEEGRSLTFEELDRESNMVAHLLIDMYHVVANCVVGVAMPRSTTQMVCVLGILKAGAAYLPLDISYPVDRLSFMLADSQVACVFTSSTVRNTTLKPLFDECPAPALCVLEDFDAIVREPFHHKANLYPSNKVAPDDTTYVIYTSGSTGKPKGVVMNHRAHINLVLWQNSYLKPRTNELRVLQFSPISFDVSFQELFTTWSTAGTVFMVSESLRLDPINLIKFLNEHRIHRIFLPFVALSHICETALETDNFPSTLEDVVTAGEQLVISRPLVECFERLQDQRIVLHNHYGPSETHVCSYYVLEGDPKRWMPLPPIGKPISNTQLYVCDDLMQLVPFNVVGELYIAGDCLGTGYLGRPDATSAAFVDCPFSSATSSKMYKTGDLVQQLPDGNILYVRRKDTQVKVRGFRIELGEIEARLSQHDSVKKCCVVVRSDNGEKSIVAYVVTHSSSAGQQEDKLKRTDILKKFLRNQMPEYMVPATIVYMAALPQTPSGKINRKGLPAPTDDDVVGEKPSDALPPATATELALAKIWSEVLKRPVGIIFRSSNFFELGGHSLTITKVSSRITDQMNCTVPLPHLFKAATLKEMSQAIDVARGAAPEATDITDRSDAIKPLDDVQDGYLPLTYNQQSLVFLCLSRPEAAGVYNIAMQGTLHGDVPVTDISDVFERVLKSHASLRTTYHQDSDSGAFYQVVHDDQDLDFNVVQFEELEDEAMAEEDFKEILRVEGMRPFQLSSDSLMRVRVYLRHNGVVVLQLVFHHVAVDLWSIDLIMDDVIGHLGGQRAASETTSNVFNKKAPSYAEYARYQQQQQERGAMSRSAVAWKKALNAGGRELPVLDIATDFPRPLVQTFKGAIEVFALPAKLAADLRLLNQARGTTMYVSLLSAIFVTLQKYSRQEEIIIGTPMACRNVQRFEQTVGYFINAIPITMTFPNKGETFSDLLAQCKDYLMNALEHQDFPFPLISDKIVGARSASRSPVFQTLFTFQSAPMHDDVVPFILFQEGHRMSLGPRAQWESIAVPTGHAMYDLVFQFAEIKSISNPQVTDICGTLEFNSDLFSETTIQNMIQVLQWVVSQMCADALMPIASATSAPPTQLPTLLEGYNRNPLSTTDKGLTVELGPGIEVSLVDERASTIVNVLHQVAIKFPDHVAVQFGYPDTIPGGSSVTRLTHRELDCITNGVAQQLILRYGPFAPDTIIGVSIRRSVEMLVAMIAVMKAGAAYVPMDPGYPIDRLQYMVSDSESKLVICRQEDFSLFEGSTTVVGVEELMEQAEEQDDLPTLATPTTGSSLAYVIYTSGSTGKPKGTLLQHRGLVNLCYAMKHGYRMKFGATKFLLFASSSFDASVLEIFCPLAIASTVVMLSEASLVGEVLARAMGAMDVTTAVLPPSVLSTMTEDYFPPQSLEVLVTAGEAINDELLSRWRGKVHMLNGYGPTENTVCSTVCDYDDDHVVLVSTQAKYQEHVTRLLGSLLTVQSKDVLVKMPPIGRPLPNYRCYVVDEYLHPVGIGIPGELVVTGPGVARGYHKLPEKTSQCFIANPFDKEGIFPVVYRTGDLVRWVGSGLLEFLGRIDAQVKLRGYRIELGEVESVILKYGQVIVDCAVDVRTMSSGKALVAYLVVRKDTSPPSVADLKAFIKRHTPDYMVPSAFVTLEALPLNPSGKVDRKSLPAPFQEAVHDEDSLEKPSPQTPTQAVLLVLAREVLGDSGVGISDDFFDVGGHSLAAMQLVSRVRDHLNVEVSIAKLFEVPRLAALADYIDSVRQGDEENIELQHRFLDEPGQMAPDAGGAPSSSLQSVFPLSYFQESLWYAYVLDNKSTAFNVAFAARFSPEIAVDLEALEKAVYALVVLNPSLRTLFEGSAGGIPSQRVLTQFVVPMDCIEWADTDSEEQRVQDLCHQPLNLEQQGPMKVVITCVTDCTTRKKAPRNLILLFHHIVSDLASMETVVYQLGALYACALRPNTFLSGCPLRVLSSVSAELKQRLCEDAFGDGQRVALVNYVDFVFYQRELISSVKGERLFSYWQRQLGGYPSFTALPCDFVRPPHPSGRGGAAVSRIPEDLVNLVTKAAKNLSTTPLTVYLSALYCWLFRVTGQTDVVVGMPVAGRTKGELEHVVGDFVNMCPLRLQLESYDDEEEAPSFRYIARKAKAAMIGALMNQEYPFQLLVQNLQQYRDPSRAPIFQVALVHEKPHHSMQDMSPFILGDAGGRLSLGSGALVLESLATTEKTCQYDLVFALSEGEKGRVDFRLQYATDLFLHGSAERFAAQYLAILESAVAAPNLPYTNLTIVPKEEEQKMREINVASKLTIASLKPGINASSRAVDGACLHEEFEAAVEMYSDHRAVYDTCGVTLSYRELNVRANCVAAAVRSHVDLGPERRYADFSVCLFLPRGVEYVIALIGSAKSNCPYTPIDVKIPLSRVQYIVDDSGCSVILTDRAHEQDLTEALREMRSRPVILCVDTLLADNFGSSNNDTLFATNVPNTSTARDCVYQIYTSGSTGHPKGVMVHHAGVVNVCKWFIHEHKVVPGDISAQALGAAFDPVTIELWPYLLAGAAVVIMDDNSKFGGPEATVKFLHEHNVTHLTFPTVLSQLVFETVAEFPERFAMRSWSCGGDKFKGTSRALPFSLINAYGPTECCVLCSQYPINFPVRSREEHTGVAMLPEKHRQCVDPPLGQPTANTALYILDAHGNAVPRGVVGELCVGGAQVGIGYKGRPEATEKAFVTDPFKIHSDTALQPPRLYHTGDLVRMDDNYEIHFVGRRDFQVKIRGFRIELGEIEAQLLASCPESVQLAVCIAYLAPTASPTSSSPSLGEAAERQLAAFIKVSDEKFPESLQGAPLRDAVKKLRTEVRQKLKGKLPDYMVPSCIVMLRRLPLTANGKVDRSILPEFIKEDLCGGQEADTPFSPTSACAQSTFVAPSTIDEQKLCGIWEELLHTKPIGLSDNWYDKGGSSLTSTMLLSRMRQVFQMEVNIQQFFVDPTVTGLLKLVREKGNASVAHSLTDVLEHDASTLDASISGTSPSLLPFDPEAAPVNVFITGVTGFLGAFILHAVLESLPTANVYCLVRAKTDADATARIFKNLDTYRLLDNANLEDWMERVVPVVGDLSVENFGLSTARFYDLSTVIDCIIHNGALVNFSYPYVSLKAANVGGTITSLKLATTHRLKAVHFISTLSTVPSPDVPGTRVISERKLGKAGDDLHGGYTQTKWVAERLVTLASERGVPCTIVRPGRITGHRDTGACNVDDFLNLFLKGCIQMGSAPLLDMPCEMTPVDFCARAIVEIALRHFRSAKGSYPLGVFHLTNKSAMPWDEFVALAVKHGGYRTMRMMPYSQWRQEQLLTLNNESHCCIIPLVPMFGEDFESEVSPMDISVARLQALLGPAGLHCPPTDATLVSTYIRYFLETGFLPPSREVNNKT